MSLNMESRHDLKQVTKLDGCCGHALFLGWSILDYIRII